MSDLHVPPVSDGADTGEEEGGDDHLVEDAAQEAEVRAGVRGENASRVGGGAPGATVVFVPGESVPVHTEHCGRAQECSQVLASKVVGNLSPGKLPNTETIFLDLLTQTRG